MRDVKPPIALLAEVTHRCPLACPYCSNPLDLVSRDRELDLSTWHRVFHEAAEVGVLQLHLSGGEPAARPDLEQLVEAASGAGLYTNLITSGLGLSEKRLRALDDAGLDHVQLSFQGPNAALSDRIGNLAGAFERKREVARLIHRIGFPLTLNAVMHRQNLDELDATIDLAIDLGARRLEVACVQFHGWALKNRQALLPSRSTVERTKARIDEARRETYGRLAIDFVPPDYYADYPKPCMGGWASFGLNISPEGTVLPCHAAETLPGLTFPNVRDRHLRDIWFSDQAFNRFRGTDWMQEPCRSCDRRSDDFGGCRCQAFALSGDPAAADPVCSKSPHRANVDALLPKDGAENEDDERRGNRPDGLVFRPHA